MSEVLSIILSIYCALFIVSIALEDNSIADVFWGLWFVIISWLLFLWEWNNSFWHLLVFLLVSLWGTRLFSLFVKRKESKKWEDPRYAQWRKKWKYFYTRSFFQVYMLQMLLMLVISLPLFLIFQAEILNPIVASVWLIIATFGLTYEAIADKQIVEFLKMKKKWENRVYTQGLWKYSRHPNYFGESMFWLWISIVSLPISLFWILWYFTITFLLLFVSWVPMKEKRQETKDNWKDYKERTNMFIPWFPKK